MMSACLVVKYKYYRMILTLNILLDDTNILLSEIDCINIAATNYILKVIFVLEVFLDR